MAHKYHQDKIPYRSILEWMHRATGRKLSLGGLVKILRTREFDV